MRQLRVLLADDQRVFLEGLRLMLSEHGCEIVGEAADGLFALSMIEQTKPDVALLDVQMPRMGGLECLSTIREREPGLKVIMISGIDDPGVVAAALEAGADAYVLKAGCAPADLAALLRQLVGGVGIFSPLPVTVAPTCA